MLIGESESSMDALPYLNVYSFFFIILNTIFNDKLRAIF